ncbi:MAG TPA: ribbon-helix-helix domain-containing protein [Hyphomicrobiales bacterium]|nr:ribbon-helix-helix domain-containing protein [Hyphomicrobiales bacterium]
MSDGIVKRSVDIAGHRTSISLEAEFWAALKDIAAARGLPLRGLVAEIDAGRGERNLSSAIRVFVLGVLRGAGYSENSSRR